MSCPKKLEDSGTPWVSGSNSPECGGCPLHIEELVSVRRGRRRREVVSAAAAGQFKIVFRKSELWRFCQIAWPFPCKYLQCSDSDHQRASVCGRGASSLLLLQKDISDDSFLSWRNPVNSVSLKPNQLESYVTSLGQVLLHQQETNQGDKKQTNWGLGVPSPSSRICDRNTVVQIAQLVVQVQFPSGGGWVFPHNMIDVSVVLESLIDWKHNW